jgi:hypothetical protein
MAEKKERLKVLVVDASVIATLFFNYFFFPPIGIGSLEEEPAKLR